MDHRAGSAAYQSAAEIDDPQRLRAEYEKLRAAFVLSESLFEAHGLPAVLAAVLDTLFRLLAADRAAVLVLHPATQKPTARLSRTRKGGLEFSLSSSLLSRVIQSRAAVISHDVGLDEQLSSAGSLLGPSVRSVMCVPMCHRGELIGVLHVDSTSSGRAFTSGDLELLSSIGLQAGAAIQNADLSERLQGVVADERKRLARLVREMPEGMMLLDASRRLSLLNARGEQLLPLLTAAQAGEVVERLGALSIDDLLAQHRPVDVEVPGPERRVLSLIASESPCAEGTEVVVLLREVTSVRERETRSAQETRLALIGQLAGGVAHDFNNLLAVILNYAAFVKDEVKDLPIADDVREIERAARRAADLTGQLLAFGRREILRPKVVLLERVIAGIEKLLRRSLGERVEVLTRFDLTPFRVKIDPRRFDQVLLNLAVNARDAMPEGGKLVLETGKVELNARAAEMEHLPPGRYAWLTVQDTGVGMPPEVAARIFEPFFTTKERGKGTGLGLATVYGLIQQAGGAISVRSRPGQGTTFYILLPASDEPLEEEGEGKRAPSGGTETILVAEDEQAVLDLTRRILGGAGYRVLGARSGELALEQAESHREGKIDLLLTDLVMPGLSGKQLAQKLSERDADTRVLFMSGYFDDASFVLDEGASFLPKPFSRDELLASVRAALDQKARARAAG